MQTILGTVALVRQYFSGSVKAQHQRHVTTMSNSERSLSGPSRLHKVVLCSTQNWQ
jgi:hypothetical protein